MGKVIVISGPSGSGKTTIANELIRRIPRLRKGITATTRKPRAGERDRKDYYFLTEEEFRKWIEKGKLIEHEEVYEGIYYGIPRKELKENTIIVPEVKGAMKVKKQLGDNALLIFIQPPSVKELKKRLRERGESEKQISMRTGRAEFELGYKKYFDKIVINDKLKRAVDEAESIIREYTKSDEQQV